MLRRDFIGRILGTIVVSGLPFVAREKRVKPLSRLDELKEKIKLFDLPESELTKMKGIYRVKDTGIIKSTAITDVIKGPESIEWKLEDWEAITNVFIEGVGLCHPDGTIIGKKDFSLFLQPTDVLRGTYTISLP